MRRLARTLFVCGSALVGCTFAGLADYDVPTCDPSLPLAQDACNQLNGGNLSCQRYQCDAQTRKCVLSALDEDRDGDPAIACGGTDCDDHDPHRSGKQTEICDGIDNDCDGVADDGLLEPSTPPTQVANLSDHRTGGDDLRIAASNGQDTYATYLGRQPGCVRGVLLGGDDSSDGGCAAVNAGAETADGGAEGGTEVHQPELGPVGVLRESTTGIAFVRGPDGECAKDRLSYWSRPSGRAVLADCGAALPSLASFPLQSQAVIAFYDARVADRADPSAECATLTPAPLKLRWVDQPTSTANTVTSAASTLGNARSTRPPAMLALQGGTAVLLASPLESSAALWALTPDGRIIPLATSIGGLGDARSVAMAAGSDGVDTRLAIVAERGCRPNQGIRMVIAKIDPLSASLANLHAPFVEVTVLADPAPAASSPSVAWMSATKEWWVTWVDERKKGMLRRIGPGGALAEAPVELGDAQLAAPTGGTTKSGPGAGGVFLVRPDGSAVDRVTLTCKR